MTFLWFIEKAKSGRSKCKGCQQAIAKDELRVGVKSEATGEALDDRTKAMAEALRWYHFTIECVRNFRKQAVWWKTNTPEVDDFEGVSGLGEDVTESLRAMLESLRDGTAPSEGRGTKRPASEQESTAAEESPKKAKKTAEPVASSADYQCPTLTEEQNEEIRKNINTLKLKTKTQLTAMLKENDQKTSGRKDELVERCAEGIVLGRLPICPSCDKAKLAFNRETGEYSCPGSFDNGSFQKCSFKSSEVQRGEWVSE
eukprot:Gregarina_sp_Pseudo_9__2193@NODE_2537_length_963_cov_26_185065_g2329_i0_p1_GENE_NODE_2537_length_963_cov_26_185065_g2329_i0NODE_2537_length_963_cov_26_185065_g2329_i0_p1_ORF_typecomplete_len277_score69_53zfPARP/PF00645_18/1_5e15zfPARP/PF00645_18/3_1e03PADR1/PF08063_12/4_9e03PADR1/PF08063_12/7_2e02PADR1/PF08063_12/3_6e15SAP/PF02037_27/0_0032TF_Zn_Ribbon/PF08271_12/1_2e03TF_Zn_Ribbon/PF08271_12/0_0044DUF3138/PF11336_8/0_37zfACC/PF17848_1/2_8zfACC/PF17848_1/3e02Zn_Tnp_IS1595/PF12760_7/27Zn_Tnp_IS15